MQLFNPSPPNNDLNISQSIIYFMNENAEMDTDTPKQSIDPYKELHKAFKNKSSWKPNPPNKTLDTFKRAVKMNLLKSKFQSSHEYNLTKEQ